MARDEIDDRLAACSAVSYSLEARMSASPDQMAADAAYRAAADAALARLREDRAAAAARLADSPAVRVAATARRWSRLHPELAHSLACAVALVGGVERLSRDSYRVEGGNDTYAIEIDRSRRTSRCSCPAWQYARGSRPRCKHTLAVALFEVAL